MNILRNALFLLFIIIAICCCLIDKCIGHDNNNNNNIFGIGVYTDTPGSPPISNQLDLASDLVGDNGWVVLYLCAWKHANSSCINRSTTHDPESNKMLELAYS